MSIPITVDIAAPDPALLFTTITDLVTVLNALISAETAEDVTPYIVGDSVPAVDDQDKVWHRLDANGSPLGTYVYYNGIWVREAPTVGGRISYFAGDPTEHFDANGLGLRTIVGTVAADYYGWQIANGQNGTANLSDQFIIGARMDNNSITGYDTVLDLWRTNIRGLAETQGGVSTITLDASTTYQPAEDALKVGDYQASGNTQVGDLYGTFVEGNASTTIVPAVTGNETPSSISIVNPFYAMAIIAWVDYDTYY